MLASKLTALLSSPLTINQSKQSHALVLLNGFTHLESLLVRQLLHYNLNYSKSIAQYVQLILYHSQNPDAFSWGCTIRFFSQHRQFKEAIFHYVQMQRLALRPTTFAVSSTLRACARIDDCLGGVYVHAQVYKFGFCFCIYVQTALVDMYSKLGDLSNAHKMFDEMSERNVVSWNSILSGYLKSGDFIAAQKVFDVMPERDVISWNSMLSGYSSVGNMDEACSLFQRMPEKSLASWNAIISAYVECGNIESARSIYDEMPRRNTISRITMIAGYSKLGDVGSARELFDQMNVKDLLSLNAMIACHAQNSQPKEALELFNKMVQLDFNVQPDKMTFASVISACSKLGDLKSGIWIEFYMKKLGIEMDDHLATALIDLYAKSGSIEKAYELFHGLKKRDLVAYSAMIIGCGINGKVTEATKLFEEMIKSNIRPNLITYTGLLSAYSHAGLVEEGYECFKSMKGYGLFPLTDHYAIMVDLLGRAGRLEEAYEIIKRMPMQPHGGVWGALLLACRVHNNVEMGEIAARNCFELEPDKIGYYSLLANIYASVERWDDAKRLRKAMDKKIKLKTPGCSWTS